MSFGDKMLKRVLNRGFVSVDGGHIKDIILLTLLVGACGACWYAYRQKILSQEDLQRMMKDMESLHMAEQKLIETQVQIFAGFLLLQSQN
jgi:hypothetical protein